MGNALMLVDVYPILISWRVSAARLRVGEAAKITAAETQNMNTLVVFMYFVAKANKEVGSTRPGLLEGRESAARFESSRNG